MKRIVALATLMACTVALSVMASQTYGTKEEAKAVVEKCAAFIKENGKEKAFEEINNTQGKFTKGDIYIYAYDFSGNVLAHGANPKLIGKNLWDMKDASGQFMIRGLTETAQKGKGWYEFKWSHPQTKAIMDKIGYVIKIDDTLWIGSGAYVKAPTQ